MLLENISLSSKGLVGVIYFGGVSIQEEVDLSGIMSMPIESFPFRYPGAPLSSKKYSYDQCKH